MNSKHLILLTFAASVFVTCGCHKKKATAPPLPPSVFVAKTQMKDAPIYIDTFGILKAQQSADLIPQVSGQLKKRLFREGSKVELGELLYVIDPAEYEAALHKAQASLQTNLAQLNYAQKVLERNRDLADKQYVSKLDFEKFEKNLQSAAASVEMSRASIEEAEVNLNYCYITAPFTGIIGINNEDPGNLVSARKTKLTSLNQIDSLKVFFNLSDSDVIRVMQSAKNAPLSLEARPRNGESIKRTGTLSVIDNTLDTQTGTLRLQGTLPNHDAAFWSGQFVDVRLILEVRKNSLVIPTDALTLEPSGTFVYVVEGTTVEKKKVELVHKYPDISIIKSGLQVGDLVVTDGQFNITPGKPVHIVHKDKIKRS